MADVHFEALEADARIGVAKGDIVLFLDTLQVSTIETTAENTDHKGGRGNPVLLSWDFGREITLSFTDALFSPASLAVMMGASLIKADPSDPSKKVMIRRTKDAVASGANTLPAWGASEHPADEDLTVKAINLTSGLRGNVTVGAVGGAVTPGAFVVALNDKVKYFYDLPAAVNTAFKNYDRCRALWWYLQGLRRHGSS